MDFFHGGESTIVGDIFGFPKMGLPQNGWLIMENLIKVVMWGIPPCLETCIFFGKPNHRLTIGGWFMPSINCHFGNF